MKCTLRKVNEGVVTTVDERPKAQQPYYDTIKGEYFSHAYFTEDTDHFIIASTFGVGKELKWERGGLVQDVNNLHDRFIEQVKDQLYEYTETETNLIIKL